MNEEEEASSASCATWRGPPSLAKRPLSFDVDYRPLFLCGAKTAPVSELLLSCSTAGIHVLDRSGLSLIAA